MADKMIQCPACEKEISSKATQCPNCGHKMKKPIYKKWWFWVIIVLVVAMIGAGGSGENDKKPTAVKTGQTDTQTSVKPEPTREVEPTQEAEPSNIFHPGDILQTNNFSITYQECNTDWRGYNQYMGPGDGKKVVRAYFVFENTTDRDQGAGSWEFDCYADGVACESYIWSGDDALSGYDTISPGRKMQGYVSFQVPVNAQSVELEYETSFWSQEKVVFVVE